MFGLFSLPKILFTIAIIIAVWQGFKWLNRIQENRDNGNSRRPRKRRKNQSPSSGSRSSRQTACKQSEDVEIMVPCPDCGAYVPENGDHKCDKNA